MFGHSRQGTSEQHITSPSYDREQELASIIVRAAHDLGQDKSALSLVVKKVRPVTRLGARFTPKESLLPDHPNGKFKVQDTVAGWIIEKAIHGKNYLVPILNGNVLLTEDGLVAVARDFVHINRAGEEGTHMVAVPETALVPVTAQIHETKFGITYDWQQIANFIGSRAIEHANFG